MKALQTRVAWHDMKFPGRTIPSLPTIVFQYPKSDTALRSTHCKLTDGSRFQPTVQEFIVGLYEDYLDRFSSPPHECFQVGISTSQQNSCFKARHSKGVLQHKANRDIESQSLNLRDHLHLGMFGGPNVCVFPT